MDRFLDALEALWRIATTAGVAAGIWFGFQLWIHNRKTSHHELLNRWSTAATGAITTAIARATREGTPGIAAGTFLCPPLNPTVRGPYFAICWTQKVGQVFEAAQTRIVHHDNPVDAIWESLPYVGLGDLLADYSAFLHRVSLPSLEATSDPAKRASQVDPATFSNFRFAVLVTEECIVWVHHMNAQPD